LYQLAQRKGVQFKLNSKVDRIVTTGKKVQGVNVHGVFYPAHVVVCNADMDPVYRYLLPDIAKPEKLLRQEKSSSAIIFYWGINKVFPQLDLHNIFFSANYKAEFDAMFKHQTLYEDPTVYVNITSKYEPQDAPSGCENWFVMVNAPNNTGQDWDTLIQQTRERILQKVNRILHTDLKQMIETESVLDPRLIEAKTSSYAGALYGNASNNRFAAFLRHPNASKRVKGLYFCGGSVHPGGGIPLCLNSAKIAAKLVQQDIA
jgi:phytoene desaturase